MIFWILVTMLLAGSILYVAASARRSRHEPGESAASIYAGRSDELASDLAAGTLDAAQLDAVTSELARNALHELPAATAPAAAGAVGRRGAFVLLTALLPLIAVPLYFELGTPALINPAAPTAPANEHMTMGQMVEQLQQRIDSNPDDPEARLWMARVMMATEQYGQAVDQYAKVVSLVGDKPEVLVQYADALAMLNGGRMAGRPLELVERALTAEPNHITALWLAGLAAQEAADIPKARSYLQRARAASLAAHQPTDELDTQLAALDGAPAPATADAAPVVESAATPPPAAAAGSPSFAVQIAVDPALSGKFGDDAMLFVVARMPTGMPMPLAVQRLPARGFPLTVTLDDSMAMAPTAKLSSATEVEIIARISLAGQPIAASGDLQGRVGPLPVNGAAEVSVLINEVVP